MVIFNKNSLMQRGIIVHMASGHYMEAQIKRR